jgi:thioredoxin-like negative regulator of GroEL
MMEEREAELSHAMSLLEEAGAVKRCEFHEYLVDQDDAEAAEEVIEQLAEELGQEEAEDLVRAALADAAMDCPGCEADRDRD